MADRKLHVLRSMKIPESIADHVLEDVLVEQHPRASQRGGTPGLYLIEAILAASGHTLLAQSLRCQAVVGALA